MFWRVVLFVQLLFLFSAAHASLEKVDTLLVLATDVSGSISSIGLNGNLSEYDLQKEGIRWALNQPEVAMAIRCGKYKKAAIQYLEWGEERQHAVVVPWTVVHDEASLHNLGEQIVREPRRYNNGVTDLRGGIAYALEQILSAPFFANRRVIDVSGDGQQNTVGMSGGEAARTSFNKLRELASSQDIQINGLAILNEEVHLDQYYETNVISGPGSFVIPVTSFEEYGQGIKKKLTRELCNVTM